MRRDLHRLAVPLTPLLGPSRGDRRYPAAAAAAAVVVTTMPPLSLPPLPPLLPPPPLPRSLPPPVATVDRFVNVFLAA